MNKVDKYEDLENDYENVNKNRNISIRKSICCLARVINQKTSVIYEVACREKLRRKGKILYGVH